MQVRSLEKRAVDSLIDQLLSKLPPARIVGPNASLSPLDDKYLGSLKRMLKGAIPGIPDALLSSVNDDLIVVTRAAEGAIELVGLEPSTLRVAPPFHDRVEELQEDFGELLNVEIQRGRHLDTDWQNPILTFTDQWFSPRSVRGWAKLSLYFARLCASVEEMKTRSGLKQKEVFYDERPSSNLIRSQLLSSTGEVMELE